MSKEETPKSQPRVWREEEIEELKKAHADFDELGLEAWDDGDGSPEETRAAFTSLLNELCGCRPPEEGEAPRKAG